MGEKNRISKWKENTSAGDECHAAEGNADLHTPQYVLNTTNQEHLHNPEPHLPVNARWEISNKIKYILIIK